MSVADFLLNGAPEVLGDALRVELTSPQVSMRDPLGVWTYGYGVMVGEGFYLGEDWYDTPMWAHNGLTSSYSSEFVLVPEHGFAISILSSSYGTNFGNTIGAAIDTVLDLGSPGSAPEASVDPVRLEDHVGTYEDVYNVGEMVITESGSTLYIEMPDLESYGYSVTSELYTYTDTIFYVQINGDWYDLSFVGEPGSPSEYVVNRAFVGTRTEASDPISPGDTGESD
jgi:hypothetical protein